jgi:asparagine synthase (glutamine-hydrolysing)
VFYYLVLGEIEYESEGFYSDINELMAGSWLEFNTRDFRLSVNRYYAPQELINGLESDISAEKAAEKTRELFVDAVRLRLRADVPVGSCLSDEFFGLDEVLCNGEFKIVPER